MGIATGFSASRMLAIEQSTVVGGFIDLDGRLLLERRDGGTIVAGVAKGEKGDKGNAGNDGSDGDSYAFTAGVIELFAGSIPPAGWMVCDGATLLRASYPELFAAIGTTYGSDGVTTFKLPDLRGRAAVGFDPSQTEFDVLGKLGGAKTHALTALEMPAHTHSIPTRTGVDDNNFSFNGGASSDSNTVGPALSTGSAGGGIAHNNLQPYGVFNYIISLGQAATIGGGSPIEAQYIGKGTTAERNAIFGVPGTDAQRAALANENVVWHNTDLGWAERYYAVTGTAGLTVKGLMTLAPAGWYPIGEGPYQKLQPTTTFATASTTPVRNWNGVTYRNGGSDWFSYNNTNGRVKLEKAGIYHFSVWTTQQAGTGTANYHLRQMLNGTTEQHADGLAYTLVASLFTHAFVEADFTMGPGREVDFFCHSGSLGVHQGGTTTVKGEFNVRYVGPALVAD